MLIKRFTANGIHGFLEFDIRFNNDLTFLTGINGSGKTSALNACIALISPDFSMLAALEYDFIQIEVEHNDRIYIISAKSTAEAVTLSTQGTGEDFVFGKYIPDTETSPMGQERAADDYYRELLSARGSHPVIKLITELPTPMFLGIDRRTAFNKGLTAPFRTRASRYGQNIFNRSLIGGLTAAARLAEESYRDALIQAGRYGERLQREMLLGLLGEGPDEVLDEQPRLPNKNDLSELRRVRRELDSIADIMRMPREEVRRRLTPLLDQLEALAAKLPMDNKSRAKFFHNPEERELVSTLIGWTTNQHHLRRIKMISATVAKYNELKSRALSPTKTYQELINQFLEDSGKRVSFNEEGYISVQIEGVDGDRPISSLSSGEAQIFTILTHLAFSPLAARNNVFVIDEPELSLHVQWQEMFVDSVLTANPNIQYILATHSPSIILERVDSCIDISRKSVVKRGSLFD